jgi:hypothetical protein
MNVRMSKHALQRALDMRVPAESIQRAIHDPKTVTYSKRDRNTEYWRRGRIVLVVNRGDTECVVVTVLWATERDFKRDMRVAPYADRSPDAFVASWA